MLYIHFSFDDCPTTQKLVHLIDTRLFCTPGATGATGMIGFPGVIGPPGIVIILPCYYSLRCFTIEFSL